MEIVLHLGAHRTATTTLQTELRGRAAAGLLPGVRLLTPAELRPAGRRMALLRRAAAERGARVLLISEENLIGTMAESVAAASPYPSVRVRARALARLLGPGVRRVGLGVRGLSAWWPSVLAHRAKVGVPLPGPSQLARIARPERGFRNVLEELAEAFPAAELIVWRHEELAHLPGEVIAALLGRASPAPACPVRIHNAALPLSELAVRVAMRGGMAAATRLMRHGRGGRLAPFRGEALRRLEAESARDAAWLAAADRAGRIRWLRATGRAAGHAAAARGEIR